MQLTVEVDVAAPAARVWEAVSDVLGWPSFTPSIREVAWLEGDRIQIGSRARVSQPGLGANDWTVTAVDAGRSFTWESRRAGVTTVGTHELSPLGPARTRLVLGLAQTGPLAPLVGLLLGARARRYVALEAEGIAAAAVR